MIHEGVRLGAQNNLRVPGVSVVALREPLPAEFRPPTKPRNDGLRDENPQARANESGGTERSRYWRTETSLTHIAKDLRL